MSISFFIPAYNCASTIAESVDSIMETNFREGDELIIVNDCATDSTADVLIFLKERYPIIRIISHQRNKGGAGARNTAVENAGNALLFCLDSDNVLEKNSIAHLKDYLISENADVASFQFQHFFIKDKYEPEYIWALPEGVFENKNCLKGGNTPGQHGNYLFTKQSWIKAKGYAEGTGAMDTWTFGLRQVITGAKIIILKNSHYFHRLDHANSYWMKDAEANLWSPSIKAAYALFPFLEQLDEDFVEYMFSKGRYTWYYNLKKRPVKLASPEIKKEFYEKMHLKIRNTLYPPPTFLKRVINKLKRMNGIKK